MAIVIIEPPIDEQTTAKITATMKDETGALISSASVDTCTLTLYDKASKTVINSKTLTNILNANNGTWSTVGAFTLTLLPADNVMVGTSGFEKHVARILYTYNTTKKGSEEIEFTVRNLYTVT